MSRKTRREKILAQLHRQAKITQGATTFSLSHLPDKTAEKNTNPINIINQPTKITNDPVALNYNHIKYDLWRITLLAGGAFAFEFVLFFLWK